jgi:hypothetical protein
VVFLKMSSASSFLNVDYVNRAIWPTTAKTELISGGRLEELREQERESAFFTEMPAAHIFETANIILGLQSMQIFFCLFSLFWIRIQTVVKGSK